MIDWEKTRKINEMWEYEIKREFALNQQSKKLVVLKCKKCGDEIVKPFKNLYGPYCANCETNYDIIEFGDRLIAEKSIGWKQTAILNKTNVESAVAYFITHPKSNKRVIAICKHCEKKRSIEFGKYHHLCNSCSKKLTVDKNKYIYSTLQNELLNSTDHNIDWEISANEENKSVREFMIYLKGTRRIDNTKLYHPNGEDYTRFKEYYKSNILGKLNEIMR